MKILALSILVGLYVFIIAPLMGSADHPCSKRFGFERSYFGNMKLGFVITGIQAVLVVIVGCGLGVLFWAASTLIA